MQQEDSENPTANKEARRPYASVPACRLSVGPEKEVVSPTEEATVNLRAWPDTKLGIVQTGSTYRFVGADGADGQIVVTSGTLDHPLANGLVTKCPIDNMPSPRSYAAGGKIYVDNIHNQWILLYHSEQKVDNPRYWYARLGLAKSVDKGITWSNLGEIISPNIPYSESATNIRDVGDGTFAIINAEGTDYMYVYFSDPQAITGADGQPLINYLAVARAPLSDVLNKADHGTVPTFYKYYNGDWTTRTGLGGQSSEINSTNFPVRYADISYNTAIQRYIMIGFSSYSIANIIESSDGVAWENGQQVYVYDEPPDNKVSYVYHSVVGLDGNQQKSGDAFYLYYVRKEKNNGSEIFSLLRRTISCSLP